MNEMENGRNEARDRKGPSASSISRPPVPVFCGVAKLVRHRTVNAEMRRFESFRHSQSIDPELE